MKASYDSFLQQLKKAFFLPLFCVFMLPENGYAWPVIFDALKEVGGNLVKITQPRCKNCYTPTTVAGIRGSEGTAIYNDDGSITYSVISGEGFVVNRITGETTFIAQGGVFTAPPLTSVIPDSYTWQADGGSINSGTMITSFENPFTENVFNVRAALKANQPGIVLTNNEIFVGTIEANSLSLSVNAISVKNWNPFSARATEYQLDPFSWLIEFDTEDGSHVSVSDIPVLHRYYRPTQSASVPESSPFIPAIIGALFVGYARCKKRRKWSEVAA